MAAEPPQPRLAADTDDAVSPTVDAGNHALLFADDWRAWSKDRYAKDSQLAELFSDNPSVSGLEVLAAGSGLEARFRLLAAARLRELGRPPAAPALLGLVVETHSSEEKHSDVVAAYADDTLRIYPSSGQLWFYEGYNASLNKLLRECLERAAQASKALLVLGRARAAGLRPRSFRVSYLWTDGLRMEEGAHEELAAHPEAAAIVKDADAFKRLFLSMPRSPASHAVADMIGKAAGSRAKSGRGWSARDMTALGLAFFVSGLFVTGSYASAAVPLMAVGALLALIGAYLWRLKR